MSGDDTGFGGISSCPWISRCPNGGLRIMKPTMASPVYWLVALLLFGHTASAEPVPVRSRGPVMIVE